MAFFTFFGFWRFFFIRRNAPCSGPSWPITKLQDFASKSETTQPLVIAMILGPVKATRLPIPQKSSMTYRAIAPQLFPPPPTAATLDSCPFSFVISALPAFVYLSAIAIPIKSR